MLKPSRTVRMLVGVSVALAAVCGHRSVDAGPLPTRDVDLRVMTYNVDSGTSFAAVVAARTPTEFLLGVGTTITEVRATNPTARMTAVAKQILAADATLVSVQETAQWLTGSFDPVTGTCGSLTVEIDMLSDLLKALATHGGHYTVAARGVERAFPATPGLIPPAGFLCVAVVDTNVILARTDLASSGFRWENPRAAQFDSRVVLPTPLGPIPVTSAWVSVDAAFEGRTFRFIGAHLETNDPTVRGQQGAELRAGPADTPLPVIIAMDSNAQASPSPADPAYLDFMAAGYADVWDELRPRAPGFTCCQAPLVNNRVSQLAARIDLILTSGPVHAHGVARFGAHPASRTPEGLWPSDHAGVAAEIAIMRHRPR